MVLRISLMVIISRLIDELRKFLWCNQFETGQRELDEFIALDASVDRTELDSDVKDGLQRTHHRPNDGR